MFTADFWVGVGFFLFVGVLFYVGAPQTMMKALDTRAARIRAELEEATRLRQDAERLVAEYEAKLRQAEVEANAIVEQTRREAEALIHQTKTRMEEFEARRIRMTEIKIAQAEAQAIADVKAAAADAAIAAAERLLVSRLKGEAVDALMTRSIEQVKSKLN